jgi:hypothetical protein
VEHAIQIAVLGLGSRGIAALERLCAIAPATLPPGCELRLHLIDPRLGGAGRLWCDDQHPALLTNTVAARISIFADNGVDHTAPGERGPSLYEWARFLTLMGRPADAPEAVRQEAARLRPDSYPSRAFYGHYLNWALDWLVRSAPPTISVRSHTGSAADLWDRDDGRQVVRLASGETVGELDAVVVSPGPLPARPSGAQRAFTRFAAWHDLRYVPPCDPAEFDARSIPPGELVLLRGMDLDFFDHMALFTHGRGGSFVRDAAGTLSYRPSGTEPRLVAGCRRGVPQLARGDDQKGPGYRHRPLFLTAEWLDRPRAGRLSFRRDVWPLVDLEVRAMYYSTLVRERDCQCEADSFLRYFVALAHENECQPVAEPSRAERALLAGAGIADDEIWDWRHLTRPYREQALTSAAAYQAWLRRYLDSDVVEAGLGNVSGALKAALDVLRDLRDEIRLLVRHAGVSGDSYRDDYLGWYAPLSAVLSLGPPVQRVEELGALIDAGVVTVLGPDLVVQRDDTAGRFVAWSDLVPDELVTARVLIETQPAVGTVLRTSDSLVRTLLNRKKARPHRIPVAGGGWYPTGDLEVTRSHRIIDETGGAHPRRFAFGALTEPTHGCAGPDVRTSADPVVLGTAGMIAAAALSAALDRAV